MSWKMELSRHLWRKRSKNNRKLKVLAASKDSYLRAKMMEQQSLMLYYPIHTKRRIAQLIKYKSLSRWFKIEETVKRK